MTRHSLALAALLLAACSSAPVSTGRLETVRQQVDLARADANIVRYAPVPLQEAAQSLAAAEQASLDGNAEQADHQLYLTERRLEIARARTDSQVAAAERQATAEQLSQAQLQAAEGRASALEAQVQELRAQQTPKGTVFTLTDVLFETGRAELKPGAYNRLQPLANYLKQHPGTVVTVQGFTDSTGSPEANRQLSQRRAEAVRDVLVGGGIEPERLIARGMGEDYPIASNATAAGRQQNRRVEVLVSEVR